MVTEYLNFDLQSSVDPMMDDFMAKLKKQLSISYTMKEVFEKESRPFVWSKKLKHNDLALSNGNKTVTRTFGMWNQRLILMDRPMKLGEHIWNVRVDNA